uniref:Glycosyltransferase n=17 Tax=Bacteria TaxID=2 RepID=A0A381I637_CLODI|nr:glycosyltransferase [Clostridioides difficile]
MRNISISYAKGEWLLILDADEVLIDYSNIIKFF